MGSLASSGAVTVGTVSILIAGLAADFIITPQTTYAFGRRVACAPLTV